MQVAPGYEQASNRLEHIFWRPYSEHIQDLKNMSAERSPSRARLMTTHSSIMEDLSPLLFDLAELCRGGEYSTVFNFFLLGRPNARYCCCNGIPDIDGSEMLSLTTVPS